MPVEIEFYRVELWGGHHPRWTKIGGKHDLKSARKKALKVRKDGGEVRIVKIISIEEEVSVEK